MRCFSCFAFAAFVHASPTVALGFSLQLGWAQAHTLWGFLHVRTRAGRINLGKKAPMTCPGSSAVGLED